MIGHDVGPMAEAWRAEPTREQQLLEDLAKRQAAELTETLAVLTPRQRVAVFGVLGIETRPAGNGLEFVRFT